MLNVLSLNLQQQQYCNDNNHKIDLFYIFAIKNISLIFIMRQAPNRPLSKNPVANRSPSPDIPCNHQLGGTKSVQIKETDMRRQRIPLVQ